VGRPFSVLSHPHGTMESMGERPRKRTENSVLPDPRVCGVSLDPSEYLKAVCVAFKRNPQVRKSARSADRILNRYFGARIPNRPSMEAPELAALALTCRAEDPNCISCPLRFHCAHYKSSSTAQLSKSNSEITFTDLFAGAGGLSLGLEQVGWHPQQAVELDPWFAETYRFNRPFMGRDRVFAGDVREWLKPDNEIFTSHALVAGVPCQPFSNANRQPILNDPRRDLFLTVFEAIDRIKPGAVVIENVAGFSANSSRVIELFESHGYSADSVLVDAADFGLPQPRRRLLFFAFSKSHSLDSKNRLIEAVDAIQTMATMERRNSTLGDAIGDLPVLEPCRVRNSPSYESDQTGFAIAARTLGRSISRYVREIHNFGTPQVVFNHKSRFNNDRDIEIFRLLRPGEDSRASSIADLMPYQSREHIFHDKYLKLRNDGLCRTITAHMRYDCNTYIHPSQPRGLTAREAARVQGFPDDYPFVGTFQRVYQQVGNAVPPLLGRVIGKSIEHGLRGTL